MMESVMTPRMYDGITEKEYKRRIWAWTMYDWANSAFATTILAAVLPIYFSQVAGAYLPSAERATSIWSLGLSVSLLIVALISPVLGTISDIMRGKKKFLSIFVGIGIIATALLVLVNTGDWILAFILAIVGRVGFSGANVFYDALLPHVAKREDRDVVSTRGYAMGYLGGGLLLAINAAMIIYMPGTWGSRLSFVSVAIWWGVFSIPLFRRVPEPATSSMDISQGFGVISGSFSRIRETLKDVRQYRQLFLFLLAFLIYNDGIGTIIGVAAIYGVELGFGTEVMILALLLVQFVGIPYSLVFGRLPNPKDNKRPIYLAFVIFNMIALPIVGVFSTGYFPDDLVGNRPPKFPDTATAYGEGIHLASAESFDLTGKWDEALLSTERTGEKEDAIYQFASNPGDSITFPFNGQKVKFVLSKGPDHGKFGVSIDGKPYIDEDAGKPIIVDMYNRGERFGDTQTFDAKEPGEHMITFAILEEMNPDSTNSRFGLSKAEVLPGSRKSNLGFIIGLIVVTELVGIILAFLFGRLLFSRLAEIMDTKKSIILALSVYMIIAVWGFFLDAVVEFWFLAWMVAVVQGGSQALSRSLYSAMSPASKSGEFFGLFGVMEKFSAILGPILFATAGTIFGSSRPAVLSLVIFFIVGSALLLRVNVEEGKRVAQLEDQETATIA